MAMDTESDQMAGIRKIYEQTYTVILDKHSRVIMAMGSDDWTKMYEPSPHLKHYERFATWALDGWLAKPVHIMKAGAKK